VFATNCFPFLPAAFFFRAVLANCLLDKDLALASGKHLSGFFLFLEVPFF
jgi:hypothetical protein